MDWSLSFNDIINISAINDTLSLMAEIMIMR